MRFSDLVRYALWVGVAATADANRREYRMPTPWVPHLLMNSVSLLMPELYRILPQAAPESLDESNWQKTYRAVHDLLAAIAHDNPEYAACVAPVAIGYILSHPKFNIYKGDMAKIRIGGFGLDAFPHGTAAFSLTRLICDSAHLARRRLSRGNPLAPALRWADRHTVPLTFAALVGASFLWELEEYLVHKYELNLRDHDVEKINMMWDVDDMIRDSAANSIGWALGALLETQKPFDPAAVPQGE